MAESIDKGIPLMTPTFFGDNDPDNPKRKTYIEREALIEDINETVVFTVRKGVRLPTSEMRGANKVIDRIKSAPTADVVKVRHGEWSNTDWSGVAINGYMACTQCNVMIPKCEYNRYCLSCLRYCPNCGAKMDGEKNG